MWPKPTGGETFCHVNVPHTRLIEVSASISAVPVPSLSHGRPLSHCCWPSIATFQE